MNFYRKIINRMKKFRKVEYYTENVQLWHITLTIISCKFLFHSFMKQDFGMANFIFFTEWHLKH